MKSVSAGNSRADVLSWLDGKSCTLKWDSIVCYNRTKINTLFFEQFISKAGEANIIPPISDNIPLSAGTYLEIKNLTLGNPVLSFENANLNNSKAGLMMLFQGGSFTQVMGGEGQLSRVDNFSRIILNSDCRLTMDIDLEESLGSVSEKGEVFINLGNGVDFKADFLSGMNDQIKIGDYFEQLYKAADEQKKKYLLGMIDNSGNDPLTPERFRVRTQPAPGGKERDSTAYGDGAVVLFIRTKASAGLPDGDMPTQNSDFKYLIPDDVDSSGERLYSGAVLVSSKVVFENIIMPAYKAQFPSVDFDVEHANTSDLACCLVATGGSIPVSSFYYKEESRIADGAIVTKELGTSSTTPPYVLAPPSTPATGMRVEPSGASLKARWSVAYPQKLYALRSGFTRPQDNYNSYGESLFTCSSDVTSSATVMNHNVVQFVHQSPLSTVGSVNEQWVLDQKFGWEMMYGFLAQMNHFLKQPFVQFNAFQVPGIDTFTLANLLFPEKNNLQLRDAAIPGDLACFGQLDPIKSSYRVSPSQPTVVVGGDWQFTLAPVPTVPVNWTVRSIDAGTPGTIGINGLYQAPPTINPELTAQRVMVTATINEPGGPKIANALVHVISKSITVSPSFKVTVSQISSAQNVPLSAATSVVEPSVNWTLDGPGALSQANGIETVYTPPTRSAMDVGNQAFNFAKVTGRDNATNTIDTAFILTLRENLQWNIQITPVTMDALRPSQQKRLFVFNQGAEIGADLLDWKLIGDGHFDPVSGVYTAPSNIADSCAVLVGSKFNPVFGWVVGYCVIPLAH
ncbi:hypothetical protein ACIQVE_22350 [Pseudomonas sp. NPDC098747]|uniref:hypothetical protein n=1 Tax=Pseudomonas sp. NPDC098747 TaxID=3364487 RepID=UPI00383AD541